MQLRAPATAGTLLLSGLAWSVAAGVGIVSADAPGGAGQVRADRPEIVAVDRYLQRMAAFGVPSAVLIVAGGETQLMKGYGSADRATGRPITLRTAFNVASISKLFTAAAVMRLVQSGRLRLDDTIDAFLPSVPADRRAITIKQLLTHTSGLPAASPPKAPPPSARTVPADLMSGTLEFNPGEGYSYSNTGYALLATIIETVAKQDFGTFLARDVFEPAGMTRTGHVSHPEIWADGDVAHYFRADRPTTSALQEDQALWWGDYGQAGVVTTLEDMQRWELALQAGRVLSPETQRLMLAPEVPEQGLGWALWKDPQGHPLAGHYGHAQPWGFAGAYVRSPTEQTAIVVLCNRGDSAFAETILHAVYVIRIGAGLDSFHLELPPDPLPAQAARGYVGRYEAPGDVTFLIRTEAGGTWLEAQGQGAVNALLGIDGPTGARLRSIGEDGRRLLDAILRNELRAVRTELPARRSFDEWTAWFGEWRDLLASRFGPVRSSEILHVAPSSSGITVFARLYGERGTTVVEMLFSKSGQFIGATGLGQLSAMGGAPRVPTPMGLGLAPDKSLVGYDPASGARLALAFDGARLTIGDLTATRVQ